MKSATPAMQGLLAASKFTPATGWLCQLTNGTVLAFTDHDRDVTFNLESFIEALGYTSIPGIDGTGSQTYLSMAGYEATDVQNTAALNVDNLDVRGILSSPSITEDDLRAGLWDHANICIFYFNWRDTLDLHSISSITRSSTTATVATPTAHGLSTGDQVEIFGAVQTAYNKVASITVTNSTHFTYQVSGSPATPATGTKVYQVRYGAVVLRTGKIGEVTIDGGVFKAELRGLTQHYSRTIGQLTSPSCRADLGDSRCTVDLSAFTVTGTLTGISADGRVMYDTARAEAGPTGGIAITAITNANPAHVTLASPVPFAAGEPVTLSGIVGMPALNTVVQVRNPSGSGFDLSIDTTETAVYGTYSSGGTATPLGSDSGYFDGGQITMTAGPNAGLSREVKSYVPGQWTLWLPFPYEIEIGGPSTSASPDYSMHVGCDKSMTTCRDRFSNIVNFRGEPYLPGTDKLVQVGRHT